jgi:hypothetical protein
MCQLPHHQLLGLDGDKGLKTYYWGNKIALRGHNDSS